MKIEDKQCEWNDFFRYNPASRHRRRIMRKLISGLPFRSVLDVGCGNGELLHSFFASGRDSAKIELAAVDLNHDTTPGLLSELGAHYQRLNLEKASLPRRFDLVIGSEVIEHTQDDGAAVRHIWEMANRWVLVTVPSGPVYPTDRSMGHFRHYTKTSLQNLMEGAGFKTRRCFQWGFPFQALYRYLLNLSSDRVLKTFGQERYSISQIGICQLLFLLFFFNVPGGGHQLFYLGEKNHAS